MSICIVKQGMADSIQDTGRYGRQHLGINPGGAMDPLAAQIANLLVGNQLHEAVIELHFPSSGFLFREDALIALSGADFGFTINQVPLPLHTPVIIAKNGVLQSKQPVCGARAYLAVHDGFNIMKWENGYGTHLAAHAGGYKGRYLKRDDEINLRFTEDYTAVLQNKTHLPLPWKINPDDFYAPGMVIRILEGNEYNWLTGSAKLLLASASFMITTQSNRMGYRLEGEALPLQKQQHLVSTGVTRGTLQLLPNGQLILLMADHPTTGGYPRMAHVISADMPRLAQMNFQSRMCFQMIQHQEAEDIFFRQQQHLLQLQTNCNLHLNEYLSKHGLY